MQSQVGLDDRSGPQLVSWFTEQWLQATTAPDPNCNAIAERRRKLTSSTVSELSAARSGTSGASGRTAQRSRSRSTSPAKRTTALSNLDKPVRFPAMAENSVTQLPADVRGLYKHVRNVVVHHEAFMPLSIREDIDSAAGCRHRKTWFYHDAGMPEVDIRPLDSDAAQDTRDNDFDYDNDSDYNNINDNSNDDEDDDDDDEDMPPGPSYSERRQQRQPSPRIAALAELDMLVDLIAAANSCRVLGRHEATWNMEVHNPLFRLALDRPDCAHVLLEAVTHASIAPPFLPPWTPALDRTEARETVDSESLDFVLALFVDPGFPREQHGWPGRQRETDPMLAEAIRGAVAGMPISVGVNQLAHAPLRYSPIAVGVETKTGMSNLEEGWRQLGVCTAAWHRRMHALIAQKTHMRGDQIVTLPLLLIVEHEWRLSFAVDTGDAIVRVLSHFPPVAVLFLVVLLTDNAAAIRISLPTCM
ncbi:hypothetical protein BT67DRAFT_376534 [Trichocladium antarcticum]|uniref:PD-(D/E)XK nuclease-like domain-containing protein n=1 Tax=Trichocladium antarcticum TaxID=1450529 RepID=A0AAN6UMF4_9PEZI|nr:hypothetical protein BT67DRAFT_376534 [Trichocladium antarcticum]